MSALLFGAGTPFAKKLLPGTNPVLMAGLLYLGSGIGLAIYWLLARATTNSTAREAKLRRHDVPWLVAAFFAGGVAGPILLLVGLAKTPATNASLLLNFEGVFTALLAWFVFRENFDFRIMLGMALITAGGMILGWAGRPTLVMPWGSLAIAGACLAWAIDNNLTRKISGGDPVQIAMLKGLLAGAFNTCLGLLAGGALPATNKLAAIALIGLISYGISLTLFVLALRHIGAARTGAYFSTAPFVGAIISIFLLREQVTPVLGIAGALMAVGVWLHLTERHEHPHRHEPMEHEHLHYHDEHHQHPHSPADPPGEPHSHWHRHEALVHSHPHYPDLHHRHRH